jgi:hypothetical protein
MKTNAVSITLYDLSGAPVSPLIIREFERAAEKVVKLDKQLAINIQKAE